MSLISYLVLAAVLCQANLSDVQTKLCGNSTKQIIIKNYTFQENKYITQEKQNSEKKNKIPFLPFSY